MDPAVAGSPVSASSLTLESGLREPRNATETVGPPAGSSPAPDKGATVIPISAGRPVVFEAEPPPSTPELAQVDAAAPISEFADLDEALDIDLGAHIEALKSFLARYPSLDPADKPAITSLEDPTPAAAPAPDLQAASDSQVEPPPVESVASPPTPAEPTLLGAVTVAPIATQPVWFLRSSARRVATGITLIAVVIIPLALAGLRTVPSATANKTGALTVGTDPTGISVLVDGTHRGVTPLTVNLPPGGHSVELVTGSEHRRIPVTITAGGQVSQFFELSSVARQLGELQVRTDPPGVSVTVDGRLLGRSPLTVPDLTPGTHTLVLQHESGPVTERVSIESGRTNSFVWTANMPHATVAGWISIVAPTDVQVYENERLLGSSRIDKIMLPAGRHDLEIVNEALGYRAVRSVQVTAGQVSPVRLEWPRGSLALNAIPWAEVLIDGQLIGETPIGSVSVPIGEHEIVFRHPELGERRSSVIVTVGKPIKVGVNLGAK
jgi:hypothetical protein